MQKAQDESTMQKLHPSVSDGQPTNIPGRRINEPSSGTYADGSERVGNLGKPALSFTVGNISIGRK